MMHERVKPRFLAYIDHRIRKLTGRNKNNAGSIANLQRIRTIVKLDERIGLLPDYLQKQLDEFQEEEAVRDLGYAPQSKQAKEEAARDLGYAPQSKQAKEESLRRLGYSPIKRHPQKEEYARIKAEDGGKAAYQYYLRTKWWKERRANILERDHFMCRKCQSKDNLQVHHNTYFRGVYHQSVLFDEKDHELETLCSNCHASEHGFIEGEPDTKPSLTKLEIKTIFPRPYTCPHGIQTMVNSMDEFDNIIGNCKCIET
jgi:hypothetical protein